MTKRDVITQIRRARASHVHWKSYVLLSLRGVVNDHTKTNFPIVQTECDFGKWYFGDDDFLSKFSSFRDLEKPHEMIHEIYIHIYTLQNATLRGGFFTRKSKMLRDRQHEIGVLVKRLNNYSNLLLDTLKRLEEEVSDENAVYLQPDVENALGKSE